MSSTNGGLPVSGGPQAWTVWTIAVAFVVYYFSFQTGYSIVNSSVQKDLDLSIAQVGIVAALYTWIFAVCQFMSGPLLDRLGARKVLVPAIALVTLGIFLFANATSFESVLLSQALVAVGACTGFVGAGYVGGTWFGWAKFSFMFGLVQLSASLFSALSQNLLSWLLDRANWHHLFNGVGFLGVIIFIAALLHLRDPAPVAVPAQDNIGTFLSTVSRSLLTVARVPHVWTAAAFGSLCFGAMLGLGVVWAPKLLAARGIEAGFANVAASFLWLGLAAGCFVAPWSSDYLKRRRMPVIVGISVQIVVLVALLYLKPMGPWFDVILCFLFGFGNSAHMLAFSTAADVVAPKYIGTSAAIVNGIMFIVGGIMISRPGVRIGIGLETGVAPASMDMAQFAAWPLLMGLIAALVVAYFMRETYPSSETLKS